MIRSVCAPVCSFSIAYGVTEKLRSDFDEHLLPPGQCAAPLREVVWSLLRYVLAGAPVDSSLSVACIFSQRPACFCGWGWSLTALAFWCVSVLVVRGRRGYIRGGRADVFHRGRCIR